MNFFEQIDQKWTELCDVTRPARKKCGKVWRGICRGFKTVWAYIYMLRSVIMAVPVAVAAIWLACMNMAKLPESVGINLLSSGAFEQMVSREAAVFTPLLLTAACLVLMFCSRRTLYPWMISIFTLTIPLLIMVTNFYPA